LKNTGLQLIIYPEHGIRGRTQRLHLLQNLAEILDLMTKIINSKPVNAAAAAVSKEGIQATQQYQQQFQQQILKILQFMVLR
jgi:replication fork clamp-binding protein CrfC